MKTIQISILSIVAVALSLVVGSAATIAGDRWDGVSVCVDHKTRQVTAASSNKCPSGATLKKLDLAGKPGRDGNVILSGEGLPTESLGVDGDFYLDTAAGNLFGPKSAGSWSASISLRGKDGANGIGSTGPTGPQGPAGTNASPSFGISLETNWTEIISNDEQETAHPNNYYTGFTVLFDTVDEISLDPGVYFVNLTGVVSRPDEPDTSGVCTLHRSSEVDQGYQTYSISAGQGSFSINGYVEILDANDGITLQCMGYYTYLGDRDEYRVQGTVLRVEDVTWMQF